MGGSLGDGFGEGVFSGRGWGWQIFLAGGLEVSLWGRRLRRELNKVVDIDQNSHWHFATQLSANDCCDAGFSDATFGF